MAYLLANSSCISLLCRNIVPLVAGALPLVDRTHDDDTALYVTRKPGTTANATIDHDIILPLTVSRSKFIFITSTLYYRNNYISRSDPVSHPPLIQPFRIQNLWKSPHHHRSQILQWP